MVVLLVDDERVELDMLEHCVEWASLGVEKVYTASNGRRALQIVQDKKPDIVITDIEMPVMDGITLSRRIREIGSKIKIIYFTGYDDFSYIKAAFKMEVVDYILKPVVPAMLKEVINRSALLIEKEKQAEQSLELTRQMLIEQLVLEGEVKQPELIEMQPSEHFAVIQIYGGLNKLSYERICRKFPDICYGIWEHGKATFLLKPSKRVKDQTAEILAEGKKDNPQTMNGVCIKEPLDMAKLHDGYLLACSYKNFLYYEADGVVLEAEYALRGHVKIKESKAKHHSTMQHIQAEAVRLYQEMLPTAGIDKLREAGRDFMERMRLEGCDAEETVKCLCALVWELDHYFVRDNERISQFMVLHADTAIAQIGACYHALEAERVLMKYLMQICSYFQMQRQGKGGYVVWKVKEYVKKHYQGQIHMGELGEELDLSPNYIRGIFKEQTGQTILEYITDCRFSAACSLLKDKNLKIREVSSQVGYENVSYFCSIFTKRYGVSPSEYRNSL